MNSVHIVQYRRWDEDPEILGVFSDLPKAIVFAEKVAEDEMGDSGYC